jgi:hypothetical protein
VRCLPAEHGEPLRALRRGRRPRRSLLLRHHARARPGGVLDGTPRPQPTVGMHAMHAYTLSWCIVAPLKARVIHPCHRTGRRASASTRSLPMASMPLPSGTAMAHSLRPAATYVPKRARAVDRARCSWPHGSVPAPEPGRTGSVCLRGRPDTTRAIQSGPRPWPSAVLVRASPGGMWRQFQKPTKFVYHDDTPTTWRSWGLQDENFVTGGIRSS